MKGFFRHWQYGIKARVVDGALVAQIDTAREPTFVRLDLARLQTVVLNVAAKPGEYELNLANVGAPGSPGATTTLASFEVRDAAEEAACGVRRALLRGSQTHRFRRAFKTTLGVLAALALVGLLLTLPAMLRSGQQTSELAQVQSLVQGMGQGGQGAPAAAPASTDGQPVDADQFLGQQPAPPSQVPAAQ